MPVFDHLPVQDCVETINPWPFAVEAIASICERSFCGDRSDLELGTDRWLHGARILGRRLKRRAATAFCSRLAQHPFLHRREMRNFWWPVGQDAAFLRALVMPGKCRSEGSADAKKVSCAVRDMSYDGC